MNQATLQQTVRALRQGETAAGNELLTQLLDELAQTLQRNPAQASDVLPILKAVLAAQQRHDWLDVADLLEYELGPLSHETPSQPS